MATNFVVPDEIGLRMILIEPKKKKTTTKKKA